MTKRSSGLPEKQAIPQVKKMFTAFNEKTKVQHRIHNSPPLVPILDQIMLIHHLFSSFTETYTNTTHLSTPRFLLRRLLCLGFVTKILYAFPFSSIYSTYSVHLNPFHLITRILYFIYLAGCTMFPHLPAPI